MNKGFIHIVRRYGPVGGMENYVYQLTLSLAKQGHRVCILCEKNHLDAYLLDALPANISIVELGNFCRKPRWLAQWGFSRRVSEHLDQSSYGDVIIHSHERSQVHHVTTFHGPPFLNRRHRPLDFLSPRIHMWSYLERRELEGAQVKAILPNSPLIGEQLQSLYPAVAAKVLEPAYPGVADSFSHIVRDTNGVTVGFLGREWKRKGLDVACKILQLLREEIPDVHFVVAGCDTQEIAHLFNGWPKSSYTLLGWITEPNDFLASIDVLLHPARSEPFGMAIAEANAVGIPVIVSDHCGVAALVGKQQGFVCELAANTPDLGPWVHACQSALQNKLVVTSMNLSWDTLAKQHIELYQALLVSKAATT